MSTTYLEDREVGRTIKMHLAVRDLHQRDLAEGVAIDTASLSRSIKGQRRWQLAELHRIARFFNVPVGDLFSRPEGFEAPDPDEPTEAVSGSQSRWTEPSLLAA